LEVGLAGTVELELELDELELDELELDELELDPESSIMATGSGSKTNKSSDVVRNACCQSKPSSFLISSHSFDTNTLDLVNGYLETSGNWGGAAAPLRFHSAPIC
jgi:hypothetical protein